LIAAAQRWNCFLSMMPDARTGSAAINLLASGGTNACSLLTVFPVGSCYAPDFPWREAG
jgi:hypothetical protein